MDSPVEVRVKNTFIHVEPVPEASSLLARGETCPAATTFLMQDPAFIMQARGGMRVVDRLCQG